MSIKTKRNRVEIGDGVTAELFSTHLPKRVSQSLPELFSGVRDEILFGGGKSNAVAFYEGDKLIGACCLTFEQWTMINGMPSWDIYIDRFEVAARYRRRGYGTKMFNWMVGLFNLYEVSLSHFSRDADNGVSESFWKSVGFKHSRGYTQYMTNKIK